MVLESLLQPGRAERKPILGFGLGIIYASLAIFISLWVFRIYSSLIMVFLTTMAALPLIYNTIKYEEEKDLMESSERLLLKEHSKALSVFMTLFLGVTVAMAFWYVALPSDTISALYETQIETIQSINTHIGGQAVGGSFFGKILINNLKVLIFCILFSFLYGSGAIFILSWNASVIGAAIGNFIRTGLAAGTELIGLGQASNYFTVITIGLLKYAIHGIPEILAYFTAGLAGGIIGIAVIRHDVGTEKFSHVVRDSADLLLLSLGFLFIAALLEVFVTPIFF
tara:strand:+ start:98 stop:946 length:849 start_codon:yes stop_codon:yes gene_type:complete